MNPFNPSFGRLPGIFIDREKQLNDVSEGIKSLNGPYQTSLVYGIRGVGKTAFLTDVCNSFAGQKDWIVVNIAANTNMLETLVQSIYRKTGSAIRKIIDKISGISVGVGSVSLEASKKQPTSYQVILEEILEGFKKRGLHLLVAIDEASYSKELVEFAGIYQILIREELPICLIMTGLPKNISQLQNNKVLTFLLRAGRVELQPLDLIAVRFSYQQAFESAGNTIDDSVLNFMAKATGGYAYAFQLLGYYLWNDGNGEITTADVERVLNIYKENLFRNAYKKIIDDTTGFDRDFLFAMASFDSESVSIKELTAKLGKTSNYLASYKLRLIDSQIIQACGRGQVRFNLPFFDEFVRMYNELYK